MTQERPFLSNKYFLHVDKNLNVIGYIEAAVDFEIENSEKGDMIIELNGPIPKCDQIDSIKLSNYLKKVLDKK